MFHARKKDQEGFIFAWQANKRDYFYCPDCNEPVILRQGANVRPHFAHYPNSTCVRNLNAYSGKGESERHIEMKVSMMNLLIHANDHSKNYNVEYRIGDRIADAYVELYFQKKRYPIAIECIHHGNTDIHDVIEKSQYYSKNNVHTLWIADFSEGLLERNNKLTHVSAILLELSTWYYGKVYGLSKDNELYAFRLDGKSNIYRTIIPYKLTNYRISIPGANYSNRANVKIATFREGPFWKNNGRVFNH